MATYLITGANRGIGLEYCRQLQARGELVVAACRQPSPELESLGVRLEAGLELTSGEAIAGLVERLDGLPIDGLIHNAGIVERTNLEHLDAGSLRRQFEVNAIAPLELTSALLGQLHPGAKVILMTSRMGSIDDNTSGGSYGYRMSKVALCMAGKSMAIDLKPRGIAVALLHPGLVSTRMTGFSEQGITAEQAVTGLLARIDALSLETSGSFWHANGQLLPW
ncbi:SDR family oxidoreductase [Synechococcus sp. CS-602]|uniref:SDR family oxidoreductase n=1 Tax=Synechococcaceae TaxID=1890426 RepID=UPI0008FF4773|nr:MULTISPECIES: SDR family oxidoreductase [Synechococcaceae]APD47189.1 short-chain dehydrogenase [Synechococcus sp. SynAce01]MCT0201255.1 SDR family oxidoreductase [Synechococcus sp. CS-603]MCT0205639.1 SDR family oxidoreductase [Synechococcus sp. CS-602]MCT0245557.1 SDR family oxidoreductase [Synechococcus sp. CS-601]MCT4366341.1 SDR family oxidoreductase [Candidatus Regnicoccus frigidus MAG-AL2]